MTHRRHTSVRFGLSLLALLITSPSCSPEGRLTPAERVEKAHEEHSRLTTFDVTMTTVVEFPGSNPQELGVLAVHRRLWSDEFPEARLCQVTPQRSLLIFVSCQCAAWNHHNE